MLKSEPWILLIFRHKEKPPISCTFCQRNVFNITVEMTDVFKQFYIQQVIYEIDQSAINTTNAACIIKVFSVE